MLPLGYRPNGERLTMPTDLKVKGLQIQRTAAIALTGAEEYPTTYDLYADWQWDEVIKPEIDAAVSLGVNTLKFYPSIWGVVGGFVDQADADEHLVQYLEYTASLRVGCYMAMYFSGSEGASNIGDSGVLAEYTRVAALLNGYRHVRALDLSNETNHEPTCAAASAAVRSVAPRMPISMSTIVHDPGDWTTHMTSLGPYLDFWDFHLYYNVGPPADAAPDDGGLALFRAHAQYKPWMIGECGLASPGGQTRQRERWESLGVMSAEPDCFGAIGYTTFDVDPADYAIFDPDTGDERAWMTDAFRAWPGRR